ncbi:MAG TPA: hypothetical protein PK990_08345 [Salinivirgaceae bacterium]|nr:hypothetical protein [Salinivirgaceae bacterium]
MKKFILISLMLLLSNALFSQFFGGGSMVFNTSSSSRTTSNTSADGPSTSLFQVIPMIGYHLDEKIDVGTEVLFTFFSNNNLNTPTATNVLEPVMD